MENNHYLYKVYENKNARLIAKDSDKKSIIADYNHEVAHYFHDFFESPNIKTYQCFLDYFGDEIKEKLQIEKLTDSEVLKFFLDKVVCYSTSVFQNKISEEQLFADFINGESCFFIGKGHDGCFYFFEMRKNAINCYKSETFIEEENNMSFELLVISDEELDSIGFKKSFNIDTHNFTLYERDFSRKL